MENQALGPAERIIGTLLNQQDHLHHGRPGIVSPDARFSVGTRWEFATHKTEADGKIAYRISKQGKNTVRTRAGVIQPDGKIVENGQTVGEYREPGLYPEVAAWMYRQIAEVWKLDNEFAAKWASFEYLSGSGSTGKKVGEHKDLKVVLAAFLLCQSRKGEPVIDGGEVKFHDEDYRDVGEAMILTYGKENLFDAKMLLRVYELLTLPEVAAINRELGFTRSARQPYYGRWYKVAQKWLAFREQNPKVLRGLIKSGFSSTVILIAQKSGYKPESTEFFKALRWLQKQKNDGRRQLAVGEAVTQAETWEGLDEMQVCQRIMKEKPSFKRLSSLVPQNIGMTRAVVAAAIEAGCLTNKDLIIATPTLEDLGLLQVQDVKERWDRAIREAEDTRAANIALRVKNQDTKEKLQEGADNAMKAAVAEVVRGILVYVMVDISSSMQGAIDAAKRYVAQFLQGFPPDRVRVAVFNTVGREIEVKHASAAGVENAFRGIVAGGGTDYGAPFRPSCLGKYKPVVDEDALFIFIGDEGHNSATGGHGGAGVNFTQAIRQSGIQPMAFGIIPVVSPQYGRATAVRTTASQLGIPCFEIEESTFSDPYAIPRTIRALIASTPVGVSSVERTVQRETLVDQILKTKLLQKPAWAA
jgi:Mg-chelatase subunit ChlD